MKTKHIFSDRALVKLLLPLVIEQFLNSMMGTADTIMVSNVGSEAISAASLVDSLNVLVIQVFAALAAGGTIICSQYLGNQNKEEANRAANQLIFIVALISSSIMVLCLVWNEHLLRLIFGTVDDKVMEAAKTYFFYTALSFPFIALYDGASSVFRAQENTRCPMTISVISNLLNIAGNGIMIWGLHMGIAGAAMATLFSRMFCALTVLYFLHKPGNIITLRYLVKPDWKLVRRILSIGVPSGIENGMFQFGKLAIQSTVSTLGTAAIAAQAMTNILENLSGIGAIGIGIGLMTVVGQCMGAGLKEEASYYIKKLTGISEIVVLVSCLLVYVLVRPITYFGRMEAESAALCVNMMMWITVVKPVVWTLSFIPAYGMRAAGDVRFSMIVSTLTMWVFRVSLCICLCRFYGFGPMAVWIGMFTDWTVRGIIFTVRFFRGKWKEFHVIP